MPDIQTNIETQKIMWAKRIISNKLTENKPWLKVIKYYLKFARGAKNIRSNFDVSILPKDTPPFYYDCFSSWAKLVCSDPCNSEAILIQPLWNNKKYLYLTKNLPGKSIILVYIH